jgi:hypothetical protein
VTTGSIHLHRDGDPHRCRIVVAADFRRHIQRFRL